MSPKYSVYLVIHVNNLEQTIEQCNIAFNTKVDGVFLINHVQTYQELLKIYKLIRDRYPEKWIGLNCLDLTPIEIFNMIGHDIPLSINGIWADNADIDECKDLNHQFIPQKTFQAIQNARARGWKGWYFGGVAFKYQRDVSDLVTATNHAIHFMDVVTTSGEGTGISAAPEKIALMAQTVHKNKNGLLAVASGITPENVHLYPGADIFLVATGISVDFFHLNQNRIHKLLQSIQEMAQAHV